MILLKAKGNITRETGDIAFCKLRCLCRGHLRCGEHIFNKNAVAFRGVAHHNVRDRADELAVLNDGGAGHECGQ